jgi:hypothetical protein
MTTTRQKILEALGEMSDLYPDMRFGQLVANMSFLAKEPTVEAIWDVEDEQFLEALKKHLEKKRQGQ